MHRTIAISLAALAAGAALSASAAQPGAPHATPLGTGPDKAVMEMDAGLPTHTVYRPANLSALGARKLPVVVWGNGSCASAGNRYRWFLSEIASHGYLVIALGPIGPGSVESGSVPNPATTVVPGAAAGPPAPNPPPQAASTPIALRGATTRTAQMLQAIDWAERENARAGSPYSGRLDTTKVAVLGHSCGGAQAIEAAADPRVTTSLALNSGLFPEPTLMGGGKALAKEDLKLIRGPIAYISGDPTDVAFAQADDDFSRITHVPVLRAYPKGVGHEGTYREANGGSYGKVTVAWLNWRLKGDANAARMFTGAACGLCREPGWTVRKKGMD